MQCLLWAIHGNVWMTYFGTSWAGYAPVHFWYETSAFCAWRLWKLRKKWMLHGRNHVHRTVNFYSGVMPDDYCNCVQNRDILCIGIVGSGPAWFVLHSSPAIFLQAYNVGSFHLVICCWVFGICSVFSSAGTKFPLSFSFRRGWCRSSGGIFGRCLQSYCKVGLAEINRGAGKCTPSHAAIRFDAV